MPPTLASCFQVSLSRNYGARSSFESSHSNGSTSSAVGYSAIATSTEPSSHISRKLTKRREKPMVSTHNQQLIGGSSGNHNIVTYSAIPIEPILSPPLFPDRDKLKFHDESLAILESNEQLPPAPRWPPRPAWENGDDLINRWSKMDVSDDVLIAELEKLRRNQRHYVQPDSEKTEWVPQQHQERPHALDHYSDPQWPEEEDRRWKKTRTAIFCCRELIRTELNYLEGLLQLENGETTTGPPPPILAHYLPALVAVSIDLSVNLLSDPTVYGVCKAFVEAERQLEAAFVSWCRIVGEAFSDYGSADLRRPSTSDGHRKLTRASGTSDGLGRHVSGRSYGHERSISVHNSNVPPSRSRSNIEIHRKHNHRPRSSDTEQGGGVGNGVIRLFRRLSAYSPYKLPYISASSTRTRSPSRSVSLPSRPRRSHSHSRARERENRHPAIDSTQSSHTHHREHHRRHHHHSDTHHHDQTRSSRRAGGRRRRRAKVSNAKELAIQPTQRIMRYVLLYRDLYKLTSESSPNKPFVEQTLESATRLARKCDDAQSNVAFLRRA